MSRAYQDYAGGKIPEGYSGFDPDLPTEGTYRMRMRTGGVFVGVKIWWGQPLDPIDGTPLDRSPRWNALVNDAPIDLARVWPRCAADPIDAKEYAYLVTLQAWGEQHAPESAFANPNKPVDFLTTALPF